MAGASAHLGRLFRTILALLALSSLGADAPEIRRVRVPAGKVLQLFPPAVEPRWMPREEFESLVKRAADRAKGGEDEVPRIVRARHVARWDDGLFRGRSELTIRRPSSRPGRVRLDPWTPAIVPSEGGATVRSSGDGGFEIDVGASGSDVVRLAWEAKAREGSDGLSFDLGLPGLDASTLILDLPPDLVPTGPPGIRQGPTPSDDSLRRSWRFDGPGGLQSLRLHRPIEPKGPAPPPRIWVGGKIHIDVGDASARWQATWTVDPGPDGPRRLSVTLDPGLEPIEVVGPGVVSYVREPRGTLVIRLSDAVSGPTPLTIRALAPVPEDGTWDVPSARPVDAYWTGGRTIVRIGPSRVIEDCQERAGRRGLPRPEDAEGGEAGGRLLVFEGTAPRSVATLTLRRPSPGLSADVRGRLLLGRGVPRFEAILNWKADRGKLSSLAIDVPAGWDVERVALVGHPEPLAWTTESGRKGGSIVRVAAPNSLELAGSFVLVLSAAAEGSDHETDIPLPRARPIDARIGDEVWVVKADPGLEIEPKAVHGLAWVEPTSLPAEESRTASDREEGRDLLAWRWIDPEGEGVFDYRRVPATARSEAWTVVSIERDRARIDWWIVLEPSDASPRSLPIHLSHDPGVALAWHMNGDEGSSVPSRAVVGEARSSLGLPPGGTVSMIDLPPDLRGRIVLHARAERAWPGRLPTATILLPERFGFRGRALFSVDPSQLASIRSRGAREIEPTLARRALELVTRGPGDASRSKSTMLAHLRPTFAYAYDHATTELTLSTEPLSPVGGAGGIIEEARLRTVSDSLGRDLQQLDLRIIPNGAEELTIGLPETASLLSAQSDGISSPPIRRGADLVFPLDPAPSSGPVRWITLAYEVAARNGNSSLRAARPRFSFPCLAFRWEVDLPPASFVRSTGPDLLDADPVSTTEDRNPPPRHDPAAIRDLDGRLRALPADMTLGGLLGAWDAGPRPVVVDRDALAADRIGPLTRVLVSEGGKTATDVLHSLGLTIEPVGDVWLVSSESEARRPDGPLSASASAWRRTAGRAAAEGSDPTDRLTSVARWRALGESPARPREEGASQPRRFAAVGWPVTGDGLAIDDHRARIARGLASGMAILLVGIATRRRPALLRSLAIAIVAASALGFGYARPTGPPGISDGLLAGCVGTLAFWLGKGMRRRRSAITEPSTRPRLRSHSSMIGSGIASLLAIVALGLFAKARSETPAGEVAASPIIALFPYEGAPDVEVLPDRVVLRLADVERLKALALPPPASQAGDLAAIAAEHRLQVSEKDATVETRLRLRSDVAVPRSWVIPIKDARDVSATLDGVPVPIRIGPEGDVALATIPGVGTHELIVRRVVPRGRESLSIPVNVVADATVRVAGAEDGLPLSLPSSRGAVRATEGGISATLGPADRIELRWPDFGKPASTRPTRSAKALVLWDAEPAGDRLRVRWTVAGDEPVTSLRLAVEPGLVVRSASAPFAIDASWSGTAKRPVWVGQFSSPIRAGQIVSMEFFRPDDSAPTAEIPGDETRARTLPKIEPLEFSRVDMLAAVRRLDDWSGRLEPKGELATVPEAEFLDAWGRLPDDSLAVLGSVRGPISSPLGLDIGPPPNRRTIRSDVRLTLRPGRVDVKAEARLTNLSGHTFGLFARIPADMRLVRVEAEGLTYWNRPSPDRLRLRFDGAEAGVKTISIEGWLPIPAPTNGGSAPRPLAIDVPWPTWPGSEVAPGTLILAAPPDYTASVEGSTGVTLLRREGDTGPESRLVYQVDRPESLKRLRWIEEPPRVLVRVMSLLTVHPESAVWEASVRYAASGGPCDLLRLKLPTAWSEGLRLEMEGVASKTSQVEGDSTVWTIRPERPIWGTRELRLRSERPLPQSGPLEMPDLRPQGRGSAESVLAVDDASGRDVALEGSAGLQPIESSRFDARAFPGLPGARRSAFIVRGSRWSLRITPRSLPPGGPEGTRVARIDATVTLGADGGSIGRADYDLIAPADDYLPLSLPADVEPLLAQVDGFPVPPLSRGSGRLLIPLRGRNSRRVVLLWRVPARSRGDEAVTLPIPLPPRDGTPVLLRCYAPDGSVLDFASPEWKRLTESELGVERAAWAADDLRARLESFDRSSARDRLALQAALAGFDIQARSVDRSIAASHVGVSPALAEAADRAKARIDALRSTLSDALQQAGLDDMTKSASIHSESASLSDPVVSDGPSPPRIGVALAFRGETRADLSPPLRFRSPLPVADRSNSINARTIGLGALAILSLILIALASPGRGLALGLALALSALAIPVSPWLAAACAASSALGVWIGD